LQLYHDATDSYVVANNTTTLKIRNTDGIIQLEPKTGEVGVKAIADGAVELYHNNVKKLETTSDGVTIRGAADQFTTISTIGTSAHEAGGGFAHVGSSTQGSRQARMWLDADGGNFSGSDYYWIELVGGGGVNHTLQRNDSMGFKTSGNLRMLISGAGEITMPSQPAFLRRPASEQSNLAINVDHTVVFGTEVFDQGSDFSGNTFTAPVTGKYQLNASVQVYGSDSATTYHHVKIKTSNRDYQKNHSLNRYSGDPAYQTYTVSSVCDMDANDTAYVQIVVPNSGTAQADINTESFFSGFLAC